ncbi:hypothetical protein [Halobacterium jilantaiense]|uniref:ABC-2 type transport system permease protein n=1 Tax=Halobacterium jilantaiense TaxID=355548 RepID=A0A1I0QJI2_9EURY|nr:hypothetical protein [Halobacterium jilantaiense]SEW27194.1 hypothetical protein SAMN04487945_2662 [Halobacterium jilantaiense]
MPGLPDTGHATSIAYTQLRVGWRKVRDKSIAQVLAYGLLALLMVVFTAAGTWLAHLAGQEYVDDPGAAGELVGLIPAAVGVFTLTMTAYLTALQLGDIDVRDGYLTTVPARDVVGGLLAAGYLRVTGIFAAPLVVAGAGFAVGADAPLAFLSVAVAVLALTATTYLVGFPVGAAIAYLLGQSEFVDRYKTALGAAAFLAYLALLFTNNLYEVARPAVEAVQASPVAWYTDLALLPVPGADASAARAVGVLAGSVVVGVLAVLASVRASERRWYDDSAHAEVRATDSASSGRLDDLLGRRTAWVARKTWLRARRAPLKLVYVVYPVFVLFAPLQGSIEAGRVTASLPATVTLYAAWATGALFTLNPLGDEGAVLPISVTSGVSGRQFVGGLVAASTLVGTPVTLVLAAALGVLGPLSAVAVGCLVVAGAVLPALAATVAAGVGTAFPKYEATNITRSREAVVPSLWSFGIYTIVFLVTAGLATGVQSPTVADALADLLGVSPAAVHVGGLVVGLALAGTAAAVAARTAVGAFDDYTSDG